MTKFFSEWFALSLTIGLSSALKCTENVLQESDGLSCGYEKEANYGTCNVAFVTGGQKTGEYVHVAAEAQNYEVKMVCGAFRGNTDVKAIWLPKTVDSIWQSAFVSCSSLKNLYIEGNLTWVGDGSFTNWGGGKTLNIYFLGDKSSKWDLTTGWIDGGGPMDVVVHVKKGNSALTFGLDGPKRLRSRNRIGSNACQYL